MLARILSSVCISAISMVALNLFIALVRLPGKMTTNQRGMRKLLRISYELYAAILFKLQPLAFDFFDIDILNKLPRTILTSLLSCGISVIVFSIFNLMLPRWLTILSLLHGAFIGLTWEQIVTPEDFQLGERLDE